MERLTWYYKLLPSVAVSPPPPSTRSHRNLAPGVPSPGQSSHGTAAQPVRQQPGEWWCLLRHFLFAPPPYPLFLFFRTPMRDLENPESLDLNMSPILLLGCGVVVFCFWFWWGEGGGGCVLISFIPCGKFRSSYLGKKKIGLFILCGKFSSSYVGKLFGGLISFILCGKFRSSYLGKLFWGLFHLSFVGNSGHLI